MITYFTNNTIMKLSLVSSFVVIYSPLTSKSQFYHSYSCIFIVTNIIRKFQSQNYNKSSFQSSFLGPKGNLAK